MNPETESQSGMPAYAERADGPILSINSFRGDELTLSQRQKLAKAYAEVFEAWNDPAYRGDQDTLQSKLNHLDEQGTFTQLSLVTLSEGPKGEVLAFTITQTEPLSRDKAMGELTANIHSIYPYIKFHIPTIVPADDSPPGVILYNDLGVRKKPLKALIRTGPLAKVSYLSYMLEFMNHHLKSLGSIGTEQSTPLVFWTIEASRMFAIAAGRPKYFTALASIEEHEGLRSNMAPKIWLFETTLGKLSDVTDGPWGFISTGIRRTTTKPIQKLFYELQ